MRGALDHAQLERDLLRYLDRNGPSPASTLARHLAVSQSVFSRIVKQAGDTVFVAGRARATQYAARRVVESVGSQVPIYELAPGGSSRKLGILHTLGERRSYFESHVAELEAAFHEDLPYFIRDMRPSGFTGRRLSAQFPHHGWPPDPTLWSPDQVLQYLAHYGESSFGALILGDNAFRLYLENVASPRDGVESDARGQRYPQLAEALLESAEPVSSIGGEQAKFSATLLPERRAVMVKFSAPMRDAPGARWADLLCSEHLAHEVLRAHGQTSCESELLRAGDRMFLEVARFDRTEAGRIGTISLASLVDEHLGGATGWTEAARKLELPPALVQRIEWRELFGRLIANNDMHHANLAFLTRGTRITGLAPAYDMLPMLYRPIDGNIVERSFTAPTPSPAHAGIFADACSAAIDLWRRVSVHAWITKPFRAIARANAKEVERVRALAARLPGGSDQQR